MFKVDGFQTNISWLTSGLYYKLVTIVNYTSSGINKLKASLNDDARVIYDRHMFILQATECKEGVGALWYPLWLYVYGSFIGIKQNYTAHFLPAPPIDQAVSCS